MILGLAKTGSTGLYNNTKSALAATGRDYYCLFEPTRPDPLQNLCRYAPDMPVLTKVMIAREPGLDVPYAHFSKRVTLVRDPRDMIVSFLLFRPFIRADAPWQQVQPFVDAIREKEADPASRSVQSLHALADTLGLASYRLERVAEYMRWQEELIDRHDMFTVRYEDFIAGRPDDLDEQSILRICDGLAAAAAGDEHGPPAVPREPAVHPGGARARRPSPAPVLVGQGESARSRPPPSGNQRDRR